MAPLHPMPGDPAITALPMFQVRILRLTQRLRPDAPMEDVWRLLGTTNVPYEKRQLWEANELRLGEGARLAADRMNELLVETPDRTTTVNELATRENMEFRIAMGGDRDSLDLLWTDAAGVLCGRHFDEACADFRLVCRSDPSDVHLVDLAIVPEVIYGKEVPQWVRAGSGYSQKLERRSAPVSDLAAEVRLQPGRLLVISGRRTSPLSLGGALFHEVRGPDAYVQTLIITADRLLPGEVAPDTPVPFLLPARPAGKSPAKIPEVKQPPAKAPPAAPPERAPREIGLRPSPGRDRKQPPPRLGILAAPRLAVAINLHLFATRRADAEPVPAGVPLAAPARARAGLAPPRKDGRHVELRLAPAEPGRQSGLAPGHGGCVAAAGHGPDRFADETPVAARFLCHGASSSRALVSA